MRFYYFCGLHKGFSFSNILGLHIITSVRAPLKVLRCSLTSMISRLSRQSLFRFYLNDTVCVVASTCGENKRGGAFFDAAAAEATARDDRLTIMGSAGIGEVS